MKKIPPEVQRGKNAEKRLIALVRAMKQRFPWISKVTQSGIKLDYAGVDASIYIRSPSGEIVRVPVQVKSSYAGVIKFRREHPECTAAGVVVVIVNDYHTDEEISAAIAYKLKVIRTTGTHFGEFFRSITQTNEGRVFTVRSSRPPHWRKMRLTQTAYFERLNELYKECE